MHPVKSKSYTTIDDFTISHQSYLFQSKRIVFLVLVRYYYSAYLWYTFPHTAFLDFILAKDQCELVHPSILVVRVEFTWCYISIGEGGVS